MIYLGGLPRSGSTWAGKVIGSHRKIRYYHEPFHPMRGHKRNPFNNFFQYVSPLSEKQENERLFHYLNLLQTFNIPHLHDVGDWRNWRRNSWWYHPLAKWVSSLRKQVPLIKDPPSILATEWMAIHFQLKVILLIRHPAAFVNSSKKAGWHYGFDTFLNQPLLMRDYLSEFKEEMEADLKKGKKEYHLENAILFWRIIQHTFNQYYEKHQDWYFIRHEDLLVDPYSNFHKIFDFLQLPMDNKVREYIDQSTMLSKTQSSMRLRRDPKQLLKEWKKSLSSQEIDQIKISCEREWEVFYDESDW